MIQPKPTRYGPYLFKSRLEARWAVFLDNCPSVLRWSYEPVRFRELQTGWDYTPDFSVVTAGRKLYLEVKPIFPTAEYLHVLQVFAIAIAQQDRNLSFRPGKPPLLQALVLGYGNFWDDDITLLSVESPNLRFSLQSVFANSKTARILANNYRFDLPQRKKGRRRK